MNIDTIEELNSKIDELNEVHSIQTEIEELNNTYGKLLLFYTMSNTGISQENIKDGIYQLYLQYRIKLGEMDETVRRIKYFKQLEKEMNNE